MKSDFVRLKLGGDRTTGIPCAEKPAQRLFAMVRQPTNYTFLYSHEQAP